MTNSTDAVPLKPCPFCGSSNVGIASEHDSDTGGVFLSIKCSGCLASSGAGFSTDPCPQTYQEVRDEWNHRAPTPEVAAQASPTFEAWAMSEGLISESHGVRFVNSVCDVANKAWDAALSHAPEVAAQEAEPDERAMLAASNWANSNTPVAEALSYRDGFAAGLAARSGDDAAQTCEWIYDDCDYKWDSACGESWVFNDGGPVENSVKFCQGCGGKLTIKTDADPAASAGDLA